MDRHNSHGSEHDRPEKEKGRRAAALLDGVPQVFTAPKCAGCGRHPSTVRTTSQDRRAFRDRTGLTWPRGEVSIGIALRRDRVALGLSAEELPTTVGLCLPCSVAYMRRFNELQGERKRALGSVREEDATTLTVTTATRMQGGDQ